MQSKGAAGLSLASFFALVRQGQVSKPFVYGVDAREKSSNILIAKTVLRIPRSRDEVTGIVHNKFKSPLDRLSV